MHDNSLIAYQSIIDGLPMQESLVMECIVTSGSITRHGIAEKLNMQLSSVCGRVKSLLEKKLVLEGGNQVVDRRPRALLIAAGLKPQQELF